MRYAFMTEQYDTMSPSLRGLHRRERKLQMRRNTLEKLDLILKAHWGELVDGSKEQAEALLQLAERRSELV